MPKNDLLNKAAILQRDGESYAIMTRLSGGVMDVPFARRVLDVAEKYQAKTLKLTGAQRLAIIGIQEDDIDDAYKDLGMKPEAGTALCRQYIKVCPGNTFCMRGQKDTLALAKQIEERFYPFPKLTSKLKIGICGCFNSCAEPAIKDIGLIGLPSGWTLMVGGAGGQKPMLAETIARNLEEDQVMQILDKLLKFYRGAALRHTTRNMRLGMIMDKEGVDRIKQVCGIEIK
jgi:NAD(P)H-nitrite reductase large subunit